MRMHMRRFTRLTNAFSKRVENHVYARSTSCFYNFVRIHKTLRVTPATAAGVNNKLRSMEDIAEMVDAAAPTPGRPAKYKKWETIAGTA